MSLLAFLGRKEGRERMKVGWCTFMLSFKEALAGVLLVPFEPYVSQDVPNFIY